MTASSGHNRRAPSEHAEHAAWSDASSEAHHQPAQAPPAPVAGQPLLVDVREGEQQILELILDGASLNHVLTRVAKAVEAQGPEIVCSILLIGPDGSRLRYGVAPSLPESYRAATDCLSIGPNAGSCGTAAYRREPVFVADILSDPLWESLRDATASLGLRACWSTPIMSHGRLLGTFAIYFRTVRLPDPTERRLIDVAGRFAAIAIERQQSTENLRRSQAYLAEAERLTHAGSWAYDAVRRVPIYWSAERYRISGFDPTDGAPPVDSDRSLHTPEDWALFMDAIDAAIRDKADFQTDTRLVFPSGAIRHLHIVGHPVIGASGEVVELVGTSMDVSEQHNSRLALQSAFDEIKVLKDQLQRENVALRDEIDRTSMFEEVVGESSPLKTALSKVTRVAPTDATVLITGETGTGKELIARAVHKRSTRAGRAFVTLNCAALAPSLISSELFGHEKGAFTGATERRLGRFELADGGTIFLDEVGDLPPDTQTMLLRVLQEREFERVGGSRPIKTDVRVIAATNRDLHAGIREGIFRADLFYRLNVFPIDVPSLRDRPEDVPLLVKYFVDRYARKAGKRIRAVDRNSLEILQSYSWPGNIRELQNVIERSVIICDTETLSVDRSWFRSEPPRSNEADRGLADALDGQERSLIEAALTGTRGKVAGPFGAAAKLKVSSTTLESKIKSLGINKAHFKAAH